MRYAKKYKHATYWENDIHYCYKIVHNYSISRDFNFFTSLPEILPEDLSTKKIKILASVCEGLKGKPSTGLYVITLIPRCVNKTDGVYFYWEVDHIFDISRFKTNINLIKWRKTEKG